MEQEARSSDDILAGFGPNERAILERVPTRLLRRVAAAAVRTKMRLQFTGWLQYVIPLIPLAALALVSGLALLLGLPWVSAGFGLGAGALLTIALFDIVTIKLRIRPPESRPARNDAMDVFDLMRARRSCRSFQTRLMSGEDCDALLASVKRHLAEDTLGPVPVRLEYIRGDLTVWPTVNATEFLVAIVPQPYDRRSVIDVGRALQKVVLDATRRGLGTCWIGPGADHESLKAHLGERFDEARDQIICICAVGYPSLFVPMFIRIFNRMVRKRLPLSELFFADPGMRAPLDLDAPQYSRFGRTFEACKWAPSSYNGQTTRAVARAEGEGAVAGVDFYAVTASRYYAPVALGIWCANWELGCDALGIEGRFRACPPPEEGSGPPLHDVTWTPVAMARRCSEPSVIGAARQ